MHVRAFLFLGLCARNSLTFAALRPSDGPGPRCQYYRSPSSSPLGQPAVRILIHAPARGATRSQCRIDGVSIVSIHAPARGATQDRDDLLAAMDVSIHAPARGATRKREFSGVHETVSIHAPARGATYVAIRQQKKPRRFNPRTREGCDIGILMSFWKRPLFQSTHPRGVRRRHLLHCGHLPPFQSTHPRGVRPSYHTSK